ncbi:xanthine dehydrogenase 1, partial [Biomphalaria pfeifferi]
MVTLNVNGTWYTVGSEYPLSSTLLDFLRKERISTGTKSCCDEGGCGVCVVNITMLDPLTNSPQAYSAVSCCLLLRSCDGMSITTIEGLGNTRDGLHPIQERLATYDGAQCGFCSPAQVMNMYSLLKSNSQPSMKEIEDAFDATLCRCTGYRSIVDAMKSFAVDAHDTLKGGPIDIEDVSTQICKSTGKACNGHCNQNKKSCVAKEDNLCWLQPTSLAELCTLLDQHSHQKYKLVLGNTAFGVHKDLDPSNYEVLINLRQVKEFYQMKLSQPDHITLGANLTLTCLKSLFEQSTDQGLPYAKIFASHIKRVSSTGIRNIACWAGNLMLKHANRDFPSDICLLLETVDAKLSIASKNGEVKLYTLQEFLAKDMAGHVIVSAKLPKYKTGNYIIRTLRTAHRYQQCQAHIATGFKFEIDKKREFLVLNKPSIVIQGISSDLFRAHRTETFLEKKKLGNANVIQEAFNILSQELNICSNGPLFASREYRQSLVLSHFYKFLIGVCVGLTRPRYTSGATEVDRPVMSGSQDYGVVDMVRTPANQPMMKVTAKHLTTGEIKFLDDQPDLPDMLYAAVVLSEVGNASIKNIETSRALALPGVVKVLQAGDIPGQNNWRVKSWYGGQISELLSSGKVEYAGQPIGLVIAEDPKTALKAAQAVHITYTDVKPVIVSLKDAIKAESFFPKLDPVTKGDAQGVMSKAPHRVKGNTSTGEQYHFHLENQTSVCAPTDTGGVDVQSTSQWIDFTQEVVSQVLGISDCNVNVETQRLGGGFGGKICYNGPVAGMCALAAHNLRRPVKLHMDLATNMQYQGCRMGYFYDYEVGFDNDGKVLAVIVTAYCDCGSDFFALDLNEHVFNWLENAYFIPNISWTVQPCKTHKPVSTAMRAPGSATSIFAIESILDHVATYLNKDHLEIRKMNLFQPGQVTLSGMVLEQCLIGDMVKQMEKDIGYLQRMHSVEEFNKNNRWKKRGLHVMPSRYALVYTWLCFNTSVIIYHADGSVVIAHGAIDMGQGIDTKAIQTCAHKFGISVDKIKVVKKSTTINANSHFTGGSVCSELVCLAVIKSCETLLERLAPIRKKLNNPPWNELIAGAYAGGINLTAQY